MNELKAISVFIRVAETGSFNGVAIAEGTTPQSVSKTIRQLERHLGIQLFHRTTRRNVLTSDGQRFLMTVKPVRDSLQQIIDSTRRAPNDEVGLIRISAARAVARKVLIPVIKDFKALYPGVNFELILEERFSDLAEDRIDVGFRAGGQPDAQVITRRLFPIQDIPCATTEYLRVHAPVREIDDLGRHALVGYRNPTTGRVLPWEFSINNQTEYRHPEITFCTNDTETETEAVLAGLGIGLLDSINATPHLRSGLLIPLLTSCISARRGLYIYYEQNRNMTRRLRLFIDFTIEKLNNNTLYFMSADELNAISI
ncbi:LysR family transcriptional regulator [Klebsiella quasipneumoniae]|uniref:LysR family transcriptional regulator n=1 Tax=Klebsiella quasipneumoniae TaxID=1463165 RepID=UPI0024481002|nr:LysR family transcriptional regulator [Klebsiella quasipneumoniae]MDH2672389.1 LysR family transcriptional regulator [Klebsiella quasipneumoniae]